MTNTPIIITEVLSDGTDREVDYVPLERNWRTPWIWNDGGEYWHRTTNEGVKYEIDIVE